MENHMSWLTMRPQLDVTVPLRSTTMTLVLSLPPFANAISAKMDAASAARLWSPTPLQTLLIWPLRHFLTTWHATSLDMTPHKPSLASIRNSSLLLRFVTVTSGFDITYGRRYWSPVSNYIHSQNRWNWCWINYKLLHTIQSISLSKYYLFVLSRSVSQITCEFTFAIYLSRIS